VPLAPELFTFYLLEQVDTGMMRRIGENFSAGIVVQNLMMSGYLLLHALGDGSCDGLTSPQPQQRPITDFSSDRL